ncbi:DNA alkylation repair protein [Carnobacterium sp. TMP28]|uniref:DNA alkylation repair protein n=1 Tax=Carnobacterium sp. TMP28 TaxID=3397060 RepID=UPI0039E1024D
MDLYHLFQDLEKNTDSEKAKKMSAYMRNQFLFLGVQATTRKKVSHPYFKEAKKTRMIDWKFISECWEKPYREAQYVAIDYLNTLKDLLVLEDSEKIKAMIVNKSWWDTVDGLHRVVGSLALNYPELNKTLILWSLDENMWLRRVAIDHQLLRKEKTNKELLEEIISHNFGQEEFFINKAIGWALRDYSKENPKWVRAFIEKYKENLSKLSIREGSKYI